MPRGHHPCRHPGCFKAFDQAFRLKDHAKGEHDQDPYICGIGTCTRAIVHRSDLKVHRASHNRPLQALSVCPDCDRTFVRPQELKRHQRDSCGKQLVLRRGHRASSRHQDTSPEGEPVAGAVLLNVSEIQAAGTRWHMNDNARYSQHVQPQLYWVTPPGKLDLPVATLRSCSDALDLISNHFRRNRLGVSEVLWRPYIPWSYVDQGSYTRFRQSYGELLKHTNFMLTMGLMSNAFVCMAACYVMSYILGEIENAHYEAVKKYELTSGNLATESAEPLQVLHPTLQLLRKLRLIFELSSRVCASRSDFNIYQSAVSHFAHAASELLTRKSKFWTGNSTKKCSPKYRKFTKITGYRP
jgi:hypothetical protein